MNANTQEYEDILNSIHKHNLQFLGLIDMQREDAIEKLKNLKPSTYNALKSSVNYHAGKKIVDVVSEVKGLKVHAANSTDIVRPTYTHSKVNMSVYDKALDPETDANTINPNYLAIRAEYITELRALENGPGCSGCQRGRLRRKYIEKLISLDKSSSES